MTTTEELVKYKKTDISDAIIIARNIVLKKSGAVTVEEMTEELSEVFTPDVASRAATFVLEELENSIQENIAHIIDNSTGLSIGKVEDKYLMFSERPDGSIKVSLDPVFASALAIAKAREAKKDKYREMVEADKSLENTLVHFYDRGVVVRKAIDRLKNVGYTVRSSPIKDGEEHVIEFGREHVEDDQSINFSFHKANMLSTVLATKVMNILRLPDYGKECAIHIGNPKRKEARGQVFYIVSLSIERIKSLSASDSIH